MNKNTNDQELYIDGLLGEMKGVRDAVFQMITELEVLSKNVSALFPQALNYKSKWIFEEKVKATTEMFKTLLEMRKEVLRSLKDEIEIRRRIRREDDSELDLEDMFNIRELAGKVVKFQKRVSSIKKEEQINEKAKIEVKK